MERHKFNTRIQKEHESFQSFVADLRILTNCGFKSDETKVAAIKEMPTPDG